MTATYVLGTGLSHNGSAVLLRDGEIAVGVEKERLTRQKHDGGNDTAAVHYCLDAAGISLDDVALVVQCELFEVPGREDFDGPRPFAGRPAPPMVTISHHLAHAYSTIGTCPLEDFDILVIDGCGSPSGYCVESFAMSAPAGSSVLAEKDSYYRWENGGLRTLWKDFSELERPWLHDIRLPTTRHSIGGFYAAVSRHCFRSMGDAGKLMGLAPYGSSPALAMPAFEWIDDRLMVADEWRNRLGPRAKNEEDFARRFEHFSDIALWTQTEVEKAIVDLVLRRQESFGQRALAYSGGVALNAVANGQLRAEKVVDELYVEPAAGDNGIALGCAFYGWLETLGGELRRHDRSTCFGIEYNERQVAQAVSALDSSRYQISHHHDIGEMCRSVAADVVAGRIVGWFQGGSEFGPRALGRRSILAHPGIRGLRDRINREVKFREDFRPFAPAVLDTDVDIYFEHGWESPYMILVDQVRDEWIETLPNVTHVDGSARVQTVEKSWNPVFYELIRAFRAQSGLGVVLNTSFNKRGQPIVETPAEAVNLFEEAAIDTLAFKNLVVRKS